MRAVALPFALAATMFVMPTQARAADFLFGLGSVNELIGFNFEVAGPAGSGYMLLGAYQSPTGYKLMENLTGLAGYRWYQGGKYNSSTYFGGVFVGDVGGGPNFNRYGGGGEIGYQWVTHHLRFGGHVGMAILGPSSGPGQPVTNAAETIPRAIMGANVDLRF